MKETMRTFAFLAFVACVWGILLVCEVPPKVPAVITLAVFAIMFLKIAVEKSEENKK